MKKMLLERLSELKKLKKGAVTFSREGYLTTVFFKSKETLIEWLEVYESNGWEIDKFELDSGWKNSEKG